MKTVYIVDDDPIIMDHWETKRGVFLASGFELCGTQTNSVKALGEIKEKRPDVVLSDLKMPGLSGIDMLEILREDQYVPRFVIVSAYSDFNEVRQFFTKYEGFDYLIKPITEQDLIDLLGRLSASLAQPSSPEEPPTSAFKPTMSRELNEIIEYLQEYPEMNHTLEAIGIRYAINPNTVCNLFARHLGTTFLSYLTTLRMENAKELLQTTDMPVKEVGVRSGYSNYFYFTRVFDKTFGQTPSVYRRMLHESH
ncbi:MAG: helix-turn-helix domain-containing protein [Lachnospiraceae bacterium]|jgi:YesN/AraC family two-component response regulator|nr:helix-turn-helix domain-containing protein [Lachnospiraceae bacterium]